MKIDKLKNVVVLDFDAGSVRMIIGHIIKDEIIVKKMVQAVMPDQVYLDGKILNQVLLEEVIRNLLRIDKVKGKNCFCCFESSQMIAREVVVPNSPNADLQDLAKFEMAQHLPVDIKNYVVQSKVIREIEMDEKPYIEAYTTAIPKLMVDQMLEVIQNVGLKPIALDTRSNALVKLFEMQAYANDIKLENKTAAFIDFGYESISLTIFQNGKFKLNRLISVGSKDLDFKISKLLGLTLEEAKVKKLEVPDLNWKYNEEVSEELRLWNMVKSTLESWFEEIEKTFRFYGTRNKSAGYIDKIFVFGELTNITGMTEFCSANFRVQTDKLIGLDKISGPALSDQSDFSEYFYALGTLYRR